LNHLFAYLNQEAVKVAGKRIEDRLIPVIPLRYVRKLEEIQNHNPGQIGVENEIAQDQDRSG